MNQLYYIKDVEMNIVTRNESLAKLLRAAKWVKGAEDLEENDVVNVVKVIRHDDESFALVFCQRTDKEYVVNVDGLVSK